MTTVSGATPFSEWGIKINGFVATCVETSAAILAHVYTGFTLSNDSIRTVAEQWIAAGKATSRGASNFASASDWLTSQGIPNHTYEGAIFQTGTFAPVLDEAIAAGKPVLFGFDLATNLKDSVTGAMPDKGVFGHAITIVGRDAQGYIAADPNTDGSSFQHYTAATLAAAGASSMVIPDLAPSGGVNLNPLSGVGDAITGAEHQAQTFATHALTVMSLVGVGVILLVVGLAVFFFSGNVAGDTPATHVAHASKEAATAAAAAAV